MWPFKKSGGSFSLQTQKAANVLIAVTVKTVPDLFEVLVGEEHVAEKQEFIDALTFELLIFGLHLTDRIAFKRLGERKRAEFMSALLTEIDSALQRMSSQQVSLYNTRNSFYDGFHKLYPDGNENLKGTLFWEFGKSLGSIYANSNPTRVTAVSIFGMTFMEIIVDAYKTANIFP
jgi:hypothetical protein